MGTDLELAIRAGRTSAETIGGQAENPYDGRTDWIYIERTRQWFDIDSAFGRVSAFGVNVWKIGVCCLWLISAY